MGASSSAPVPPPPPVEQPPPVRQPIQYRARAFRDDAVPGQSDEIVRMAEEAKPHRCASRLDDFVFSIFDLNFQSTPSRTALLYRCFRSEMGQEPRDPHINVPQKRLPRWDPRNKWYDPQAPYDSFPRPLGFGYQLPEGYELPQQRDYKLEAEQKRNAPTK